MIPFHETRRGQRFPEVRLLTLRPAMTLLAPGQVEPMTVEE